MAGVESQSWSWDYSTPKTEATANPAAGAEPNGVTATATRYRLYALRFELVTDANVANRTITCSINLDGTNPFIVAASTTAHTAGLTRQYCFYFGKTLNEETIVGTQYHIGLGAGQPFLELPIGATVTFVITNKQAGDDATATTIVRAAGPN